MFYLCISQFDRKTTPSKWGAILQEPVSPWQMRKMILLHDFFILHCVTNIWGEKRENGLFSEAWSQLSRLSLNFPCSPSCPQTLSDSPASASWELRLQSLTITDLGFLTGIFLYLSPFTVASFLTKRTTEYPVKNVRLLGVMVHTFNPSTREAESSRSLWVWNQLGLQSEFQDSRTT